MSEARARIESLIAACLWPALGTQIIRIGIAWPPLLMTAAAAMGKLGAPFRHGFNHAAA